MKIQAAPAFPPAASEPAVPKQRGAASGPTCKQAAPESACALVKLEPKAAPAKDEAGPTAREMSGWAMGGSAAAE